MIKKQMLQLLQIKNHPKNIEMTKKNNLIINDFLQSYKTERKKFEIIRTSIFLSHLTKEILYIHIIYINTKINELARAW